MNAASLCWVGVCLIGVLPCFSAAMVKHWPEATWEKAYFTFYIIYGSLWKNIKAGAQGRNLEAGTKARTMEGCHHWLVPRCTISYLSKDGTTHSGLGPPASIKKVPHLYAHRLIWCRQFPIRGSIFPCDFSLCRVDSKTKKDTCVEWLEQVQGRWTTRSLPFWVYTRRALWGWEGGSEENSVMSFLGSVSWDTAEPRLAP